MESGIRPPAVAGAFYPAREQELSGMLTGFFKVSKKVIPGSCTIKALIVPHAGYIYSGQTAATGFAQLPKNLPRPHFVLIGPSHRYHFAGLAGSSAHFWQTPLGTVTHLPASPENDTPHETEHCLEVQLPFLQSLYSDFSVTCLLTGGLLSDPQATSHELLAKYASGIFIISSDLSHYLPLNKAKIKDHKTIDAILNSDTSYFYHEDNVACGAAGIILIAELGKRLKWHAKLINYATSAPASGDPSAVVGYAAIALYA